MKISIALAGILLLLGCAGGENKKLPLLGRHEVIAGDTTYQRIADFRFMDQDSTWVTNATFENKAYVADFFFTSCPSICPIMKKQMLRVYNTYRGNPEISFLSHTIDPRHDSVPVLHKYAADLGVSSDQWSFVTGPREEVYAIAENSYMVATKEEASAPGGFIHGGHFILVDKDRHIRGIYDGTDENSVDQLIKDIPLLLNEGVGE